MTNLPTDSDFCDLCGRPIEGEPTIITNPMPARLACRTCAAIEADRADDEARADHWAEVADRERDLRWEGRRAEADLADDARDDVRGDA